MEENKEGLEWKGSEKERMVEEKWIDTKKIIYNLATVSQIRRPHLKGTFSSAGKTNIPL